MIVQYRRVGRRFCPPITRKWWAEKRCPPYKAEKQIIMQTREIELILSSITNGRIYFPTTDAKFFPADSFGDRTREGHKGNPVTFKAGSFMFTDHIRISSGIRFSPKCYFKKYLVSVGAKPSDILKVTRTSEREYLIEHFPL